MTKMDKCSLEVLHIGGEAHLELAKKEFKGPFSIIGCTREYLIIGDSEKNISISRKTNRIIERFIFGKPKKLERKV